MSEVRRDFVNERNHHALHGPAWPVQLVYGLNRFELFSGAQNFLRRSGELILDNLPFNVLGRSNYISDSLKLTRYRSVNADVL